MNKKYQREMEQIHAPRELIDRTKREVREAGGQTQKAGRKTLVFFPLRQAAALAAALVLIVLVSMFWLRGKEPAFAVISEELDQNSLSPQFGLLDPQQRNVSAEEFDQAFETAAASLEGEDFSAYLVRSLNGEVESGRATFLYENCRVAVARGEELLPQELTATAPQQLAGLRVYLAREGTGECLLAGFELAGNQWLLETDQLKEQAFAEVVARLAESQQKNG